MPSLIQAVTFDFWNTLFVPVNAGDERHRQIKQVVARNGFTEVSDRRIKRAISGAWSEWDRIWKQECRTFGADEWVSRVLARLGITLVEQEREALIQGMAVSGMEANPPLVDGLTTVLPRLAQSYRLGLICDTGLSPGWMLREWMDSHGILQFFSYLTFSDELGRSKPHPDAFVSTLTRLGISPQNAVHVGDFPRTDIAGAQRVGMRAVQFTGVFHWDNTTIHADAEIASYGALEPLLIEWEN